MLHRWTGHVYEFSLEKLPSAALIVRECVELRASHRRPNLLYMLNVQTNRFVFSTRDTTRYRFPTHTNDLIMDRSEAETSEAFMVVLEPGEAPPLHKHDDTEQVFYVVQGTGRLHIGATEDQQFPVAPGDLVRIPRGTPHRIQCQDSEPLIYLSVDCF